MSKQKLKIAKAMHHVSMWVHPEGLVNGSIFVTLGEDTKTQEDPKNVLNDNTPFLVLQKDKPSELRFYNRNSIVRVEYEMDKNSDRDITCIPCRVCMMDGSVIDGEIAEVLPTEHARLYDYLNKAQERFIRLFTSDTQVCMVNKSYIIQVTSNNS